MKKQTIRQVMEQATKHAKQLKQAFDAKFLALIMFIFTYTTSLTLTGCSPKMYENVVFGVKGSTIFVYDPATGARKAIICSKKSDAHPNLQKDLQWFQQGDVIKFFPADEKSYELDRVFNLQDLKAFEYPVDTMRNRDQKAQEAALEVKAGINTVVTDTLQNVR